MHSIKLFEWQVVTLPKTSSWADNFILYLNDIWASRVRYSELDEDERRRQAKEQCFFTFQRDGKIKARKYVGVVQFDGVRIEVYPKIFQGDEPRNFSRYQLNLLYWLSYCRKVNFPFSLVDLSKIDFDDYLELLVYIFSNYTLEIISSRPYQHYQQVTEETTFLKGRLHFEDYLNKNIMTGRWQNFQSTHAPFIYDNLFNRIVKFVSKRLLAISTHTKNRERLSNILFLLDEVTDTAINPMDCEKISLNPLFSDLHNVMSLCKLFLANQMFDVNDGSSRNFCFLVPMEYVFEEFIYGFLSEHWPSLGLKSQSESYLAISKEKSVFKIKNDIYIPKKLIIDAKYKMRSPGDGLKGGVSQDDLYQLISYSIRRECPDSLLLYPVSTNTENTDCSFTIPAGNLSDQLNIEVRNIDITFHTLTNVEDLLIGRFQEAHPIFG